MTKIVNIRSYKGDYIFCGRGSLFGNPYTHIKHKQTLANFIVDTREESIECYRIYFYDRIEKDEVFKERVLGLKGKTIGCYCVPMKCHLEIIVDYLEKNG